jgi:glyoxylate/hydroxypyruvate reductase A
MDRGMTSRDRPALVVSIRHGEGAEVWVDRLRALLPALEVGDAVDEIADEAVRYVVSWNHRPGSLRRYPHLRAIFSLGAGVDHIFADTDLPDVPIVRVVDPDLTARMSEYVVLHVLMHHRQQRRYDRQQRARAWRDDADQPAARNVRVGIMGLGVLGLDAARKLRVVGFDVAGWSLNPKRLEGIETHHGMAGLPAFLARTQILVALLPLTPATTGILDAKLLRGLARDCHPPGAVLINAGRGGLQVEDDILACLDDGSLRGVTLDVFETEPLPKLSRLWSHPAVTVTPHNSAISAPDAVAAYIAEQVRSHEAGAPLRNVVDRATLY